MKKKYGYLLKKQRKDKGITQKELAILIGCSVATIKNIENKEHIPNIAILKAYKKIFPSINNSIDEILKETNKIKISHKPIIISKQKENSNFFEFDIKNIDQEVKNKIKEYDDLKRLINVKRIEYEALERTSGVRSRITWACIDIQKSDTSKMIEIVNIFNMAESSRKKECLPALEQLWKHFKRFEIQLEKLINDNKGEIYYE